MIPHSGMYLWHLFQKNYNKKFSVSWLLIGSTLTHYHWENYSRLLWDVLTNCVNKKSSSRNSSKRKNLSNLLAKSLTWLSSAKIQRSVTAHPRESLTSRNPYSHFHLGNGIPNSFAFSKKGNPIPNGFLTEGKADVSFAKRKVILPKIAQLNLIKQSSLSNTWNPLQNFSQPQIKLNTCFLNKKSQMMIQSLPYQ